MNPVPPTMQAWVMRGYGGAEAMHLESVAVPRPGPGELLMRVEAAGVNPIDWKLRAGLLRERHRLTFPRVPGRDGVGTVVALGEGCDGFALGDRVLALAHTLRDGTHAEFAVVSGTVAARVPLVLPAADAACLGAGGVGGLAIQIARHMGAEVLATCGSANIDYCASLGAHRVIDYSREQFESVASRCDVVFDLVGGEVHRRSFAALKPGGLLVRLTAAPVDDAPPRADVRVVRAEIRASATRLAKLLEWAEAGYIRPQVGRVFALAEARDAYALSEGGHARGKIMLKVPAPGRAAADGVRGW